MRALRAPRPRPFAVICVLSILICPALCSRALAGEVFTMSVIGDQQWPVGGVDYLQYYTSFTAQTDWLAANAQANNIRFVTQVGDIVEHGSNLDEWDRAEAAMATLDAATNADGGTGIPWSVAFGNHEMDSTESGTDPAGAKANRYREYFGSDGGTTAHRYTGQVGFGGVSSNDLNTYHFIKSSDAPSARTYLLLNMEFDIPGHPPDATPDPGDIPAFDAIAWAQGIIDMCPGMPTMITTHVFEGTAFGPPNNPYVAGPGRNSQLEIFDKLIDDNPQIFLVNSGHTSQDTHQVKTNAAGFPVLQMSTDYNKVLPNYGDGFMRLIEIDENSGEIRVKTYTPGVPQNPTPRYDTSANGQFTVSMEWNGRFAPLPTEFADARLRVDRITGAMTLENTSSATSPLAFREYSITSSLGALDARLTNWKPISVYYDVDGDQSIDDDDNWTILTSPLTAGQIELREAEWVGDGGVLGIGESLLLSQGDGTWIPSPNESDLVMQITLADANNTIIYLPVEYEGNANQPLARSDLNHDGNITGADWNIFQANFPSTDLSGFSSAQAYAMGDVTGPGGIRDHVIDVLDFLAFKGDFVAANGAAAFSALTTEVPEPWSLVSVAFGVTTLLVRRRHCPLQTQR